MKTIEFEADVRDSRIQVPRDENLEACHVKVILMWDQERARRSGMTATTFSPPVLKTKGYRFDRKEANARR